MTSIDDLVGSAEQGRRAGGSTPELGTRRWSGQLARRVSTTLASSRPVPAIPTRDASVLDIARSSHQPNGVDLSPARRRVARAALWARNLGALLLLFVAYQLWGTSFDQARDQSALQHAFGAAEEAPLADGPVAPAGPPPLPGTAVARIEIPTLGVDQFVVEGTGVDDLRKGPGHYAGSPLPGHPGNAAIAGHRTTYGAPFNRLDELNPGDQIVTTTRQGRFLYVVDAKPVAQSPQRVKVVNEQGDDRLTLTTCNPKYSAAQRLIVVAKLRRGDGSEAAPAAQPGAAAPPAPPAGPTSLADVGGGWHGGALPASMLFTAALVGLCLFSGRLELVWSRLSVLGVSGPVGLCLLLLLFENLNRLLPSNV